MGDLHMLDLTGLAANFSPKLSVFVPPTSLLHDLGSMVKDINLCVPKCSALSTSALAISTLRGGEGGPAGGIASAAFEEQERRARQARSLLRRVYKRKDPNNNFFKKIDFPVYLNCTSLPYAVKTINDQEPLGVEVLNDTVDEDDFDEDDFDEESVMEKSKNEEDGHIMTDETEGAADGSMLSSSSTSAAVGGSVEEDERFSRNIPFRESAYPRRGVSYPLQSSTVSSSPFPLSSYENIFRERFGEKLGHNFLAPVSPSQQNNSSSSSSSSIAADHLQDILMSSRPVVKNTTNTTSSRFTSTNTTIDPQVVSEMYTPSSPGGGCNHIYMGGSRNGGGASAMPISTLHQPPEDMQNDLTTLTSKTLPLSQQIEQQKQQTTISQIQGMYDAAAVPVSDPSHALYAADLGTAASGFADVCFIVENHPISLHRCVLVARCEYFRAMFSSAFADANTRVIRLEDVELPVFEAAVRYIYTDQLPTADDLDALCLPLLALSQRLGLKRLSSQCQRHLEGNVSVENAASMLETADMYGARPLRRACVNFITEHHTEVTCFMGSIIINNLLSSVSTSTTTSSSSASLLAKKKTLRSPGQSPGSITSTASSLLAIAAAAGGGTGIMSLSSPSSGFVRQSMSLSTTSNNAPLSLHSTRTSTSSSHITTSSIHGDNEQRSVDPSISLATSLQNDLLTSVVTSDTTLQKHLQYRSLLRAARSRDRDRLLTTGLTGLLPRTGRSSSREVGFTGNFEQETLQANSQLAASGALSSSPGLFIHLDTHPYPQQHHNHSVSYPISPSYSTSALLESERRLVGVLDSGGGSVSSDLAMLRIQCPLSPSASITSGRPVGHTNSSWEPSTNLSPSANGESVVIRSQSTSIQGVGGVGELSFASKLAMVASSASQPPNRYSSSLAHSPSSSSASASGVTSSQNIQPDDELANKSPLSGSKRRRERETSTPTTTDGTRRGPLELASDDDEINISSMDSQVNVGASISSSSGVGGGGGGGGGGGSDNVSFFVFTEKGLSIEKEDATEGSSSAHSNSGKKRRQGEGSEV